MITVDEIVVDDFKAWFTRDFEYSIPLGATVSPYDCQKDYVMDSDITKAFTKAKMNFNPGLFGDTETLKATFLYLAAHYLVTDLQASEQGPSSTGYLPVASKSVGPVSESYAVPEWMTKNPVLGFYATTRYGQEYLSLVKPLLIGNVSVYEGATTYR
jgi:hypothetical protein